MNLHDALQLQAGEVVTFIGDSQTMPLFRFAGQLAEVQVRQVNMDETDWLSKAEPAMVGREQPGLVDSSLIVPLLSRNQLTSTANHQVINQFITWLNGLESTARIIPLLTGFNAAEATAATIIARQLLASDRIQAVAIGTDEAASNISRVENRVAAIVLAAGRASRFGSPKQLAVWQGKSLLAHVVDAALASHVAQVIVVLGAHADACCEVLVGRPVQIVLNQQWAEGQSTSMKAGLAALTPTISAALFPLADQPFVTAAVINALIEAYQQTLKPIVWPEYDGRRGNPVLFDRRLFSEMNQISGDVGARPVLMAHQTEAGRVAVDEPGILQDIDRPEDL
jgi:molybdenum cofactor cytidylyltransferase